MNRSTIKGILFIISCAKSAVSVFLPYYTVAVEGGDKVNITLMPTLMGIIILLIDAASVFMVFAGLQQKCGFIAAANVIAVISTVIRMSAGKKALVANAMLEAGHGSFTSILGVVSNETEVEAAFGIGFFLLIIGGIAAVITGIMFAIERD